MSWGLTCSIHCSCRRRWWNWHMTMLLLLLMMMLIRVLLGLEGMHGNLTHFTPHTSNTTLRIPLTIHKSRHLARHLRILHRRGNNWYNNILRLKWIATETPSLRNLVVIQRHLLQPSQHELVRLNSTARTLALLDALYNIHVQLSCAAWIHCRRRRRRPVRLVCVLLRMIDTFQEYLCRVCYSFTVYM